MAKSKSPRYDADYDAMQCSVRNGLVCRACANRIAFLGKRGEKGAWNKPCQGVNKPNPSGLGRRQALRHVAICTWLDKCYQRGERNEVKVCGVITCRRSSYGGNKTNLPSFVASEAAEDDLRPLTPEPESEPKALSSASVSASQSTDTIQSIANPTPSPQTEMSL